ncbi:hypothetical protein CPAV1605_1234 [seawater metagenome]|uniref:Uncharacterized protein n=1 Tax=seawater metagenome TaxID=1561972 RepID=A0A5E8CJA0_9ZZZZ
MNVKFDFNNNTITLKYNNQDLEKTLNVISLNEYTKMASISYLFNEDHKFVFNWLIWMETEQFLSIEEYKKKEDLSNPWKILAKWSFISNPVMGTSQTNNVYKIKYNSNLLPELNTVKLEVIGCSYGDWNTQNATEGYYY